MIKPHRIKPITIKLDGEESETIVFYPRMAFKSERDDVAKQLAEVGAESIGQGKRIFEIMREAVAAWSTKPPELVVKVKGENTLQQLVADVKNAADSINQFFDTFTVEHEEIISTAYYSFFEFNDGESKFFTAFRLICRVYFPYTRQIGNLHFKYDFCPTECVETGSAKFDGNRFEFCQTCPKKLKKEEFRRKYEQAAAEILPNEHYQFVELLNLLYAIRNAEDLPADKLTVKDADLLSIFWQSRDTFQKERDWKK